MKQSISMHEGVILYNFIREHNIKTVVETGIYHGTSSAFILDEIGETGHLTSIDPDLSHLIEPHRHNWTIMEARSQDVLETALKVVPDMFFHDSRHDYETMMFEYKMAYKYGVQFIGSHDINHPGIKSAWQEFINDYNIKIHYTSPKFAIGEI